MLLEIGSCGEALLTMPAGKALDDGDYDDGDDDDMIMLIMMMT